VEQLLNNYPELKSSLMTPTIKILEAFNKTREDLLDNIGVAIVDKTKAPILEKWLADTIATRLIFNSKFRLEFIYAGKPLKPITPYEVIKIFIADEIKTILKVMTLWCFEQCSHCHRYYIAGPDEDACCTDCNRKYGIQSNKTQGVYDSHGLIIRYSRKKILKEFGFPFQN
jgi:hypothetical protein